MRRDLGPWLAMFGRIDAPEKHRSHKGCPWWIAALILLAVVAVAAWRL